MNKDKIAVTFYKHLDEDFYAKVENYRKANNALNFKQALIALAVKGLGK